MRYLESPLDTKPTVSKGSCFVGLSLSHGADDLRINDGAGPAIPVYTLQLTAYTLLKTEVWQSHTSSRI